MKLALQTDYALRTLLYLATEGGRATVGDLAGFYGISVNHLGKVVHQLGRLGYIRSVRGPGGGIELVRPAAEITVGGVVRDFEGRNIHLLDCVILLISARFSRGVRFGACSPRPSVGRWIISTG